MCSLFSTYFIPIQLRFLQLKCGYGICHKFSVIRKAAVLRTEGNFFKHLDNKIKKYHINIGGKITGSVPQL